MIIDRRGDLVMSERRIMRYLSPKMDAVAREVSIWSPPPPPRAHERGAVELAMIYGAPEDFCQAYLHFRLLWPVVESYSSRLEFNEEVLAAILA